MFQRLSKPQIHTFGVLISCFSAFFAANTATKAQAIAAVEVTEQTLKIDPRSEETLYYAFAEGDHIFFSFSESNKKELKEVSISEYPNNLRFKVVDSDNTTEKQLYVQHKGIFSFVFKNNALLGSRTVKLLIRRVPSSAATRNFDTGVQWRTVRDTTYEYGADWELKEFIKTQKKLVRTDTQIVTLFDKNERLDGKFVYNGKTESTVNFKLPTNVFSPDAKNPYRSTELVSWAYWLGVGTESGKIYNDQNKKMVGVVSAAAKLAGPYGVMAGLAIDGVSLLTMQSPTGDNVGYAIAIAQKGKPAIVIDKGNSTTASARNTTQLSGDVAIHLLNDNLRESIDVSVKVVAVQVQKIYEDQTVTTNQYVAKNANASKKALVKESKIPDFR